MENIATTTLFQIEKHSVKKLEESGKYFTDINILALTFIKKDTE